MKAVIPAAGFGTRFLPIAKAVPKEMLPLGGKPIIHYVVEEAAAAGCDEVLIVLRRGKEAISAYFATDPELEQLLEGKGAARELAEVRAVSRLARFHYTYQPRMLGLGDAILQAREFVGQDEAFAVLLGDAVMQHGSPLPAMVEAWRRHGTPAVALEPCPEDKVSRYGVAGGRQIEPDVFALDRLVEKPRPDQAPRLVDGSGAALPHYAFAARYVLPREIFDALDATAPGYGGEVQLTDAMERVRACRGFLGVRWAGRRFDIGNPAGLAEAARALGQAG